MSVKFEYYQTMEEEFAKISKYINEYYNPETSNDIKEEARVKLSQYSTRIECLDLLDQYLAKCSTSTRDMLIIFLLLRDLVKSHPLIPLEIFTHHFTYLMQFIQDNSETLIKAADAMNIATQALAVTTRILIERFLEKGQSGNLNVILQAIQNLFGMNDVKQMVALQFMAALVQSFSEPFPHLQLSEQNQLKAVFQEHFLSEFLKPTHDIVLNANDDRLIMALRLLEYCFEFFDKRNDVIAVYMISYPAIFNPYFTNPDILNRLFSLFEAQNDKMSKVCYKVLYYMTLVSGPWFHQQKLPFFSYFATLLQNLISKGPPPLFFEPITKLLSILPQRIDIDDLFQNLNPQEFIQCALNFSLAVFGAHDDIQSHINIFMFWQKISDHNSSTFPPEFQAILSQTMIQIFTQYVELSLQSIEQDYKNWIPILQQNLNEIFLRLWSLSGNLVEHIYGLVSSQIERITGQEINPATLLQLTYLILLGSNRIKANKLPIGENDSKEGMFKTIIIVIHQTNEQIQQIISQNSELGLIFENAVIQFIDWYQSSYFRGESLPTGMQNMGDPEIIAKLEYQQNVITTFINRILKDLATPNLISDDTQEPPLFERILKIIEQLVDKKECKQNISNANLLNPIEQNLSIPFNEIEITSSRRPRIYLFRLYTSLITNNHDLNLYLQTFDARFQELAKNYSNVEYAFGLYCDLHGVFKYFITAMNSSSKLDLIDRYLKSWNWFMTKHVQDTNEVIQHNATNQELVKLICSFWVTLFPDRAKNDQKSLIDKSGGFGITLFKASLLTINQITTLLSDNFSESLSYILLRVIRYCMTTKYANFGVMTFYNDNSFLEMAHVFFTLLSIYPFHVLINHPKLIQHVLYTLQAITQNDKCIEILFGDDKTNLQQIFTFLTVCIRSERALQYDDTINRRIVQVNLPWEILQNLLRKSISNSQCLRTIELYRPIDVLIMQNLMIKTHASDLDFMPLLLASYMYDGGFIPHILEIIINSYNAEFQEHVRSQFVMLFNGYGSAIDFTVDVVNDFRKRAEILRTNLKKYPTSFLENMEIAQLFPQF